MPATFVSDCPRCSTKQTTFDALASRVIPGSTDRFNTFGVCRTCAIPTIFELYDVRGNRSPTDQAFNGKTLRDDFQVTITPPAFENAVTCPDYVPDDIESIFSEASRCFAVGAFDASGAMSRKVLDASTRSLIGIEPQSVSRDDPNYISWKEAKDLRLRLDWLFARGKLPPSLVDLASCVHQDGNDAAHSSETIGREAALDLQDFTISILETLYTIPGRIAANIDRRNIRRNPREA